MYSRMGGSVSFLSKFIKINYYCILLLYSIQSFFKRSTIFKRMNVPSVDLHKQSQWGLKKCIILNLKFFSVAHPLIASRGLYTTTRNSKTYETISNPKFSE